MNRQHLYKIIFGIGYITIFVVSLIPVFGDLSSVKIGPEAYQIRLDFILHFAIYFSICLYYFIGVKLGYRLFGNNSLAKFIVLMLLLAVITEVVQFWISSRTFNSIDIISNVMGIIAGVIIIKSTNS